MGGGGGGGGGGKLHKWQHGIITARSLSYKRIRMYGCSSKKMNETRNKNIVSENFSGIGFEGNGGVKRKGTRD